MNTHPTTLITGASSGIGEALSELLAAEGHSLILVARREDRLAEIASRLRASGTAVEIIAADLSTLTGIDLVVERAGRGDIDHLVNNAGAGGYAPLATLDAAEVAALWTLNATAPLFLARAVLPHLLEQHGGGILTVASLLAFSAGQDAPYLPNRTIYAAAKAAGVAFSRTLATEVAGTGVHATVVCPGRVRTEFSNGAAENDPDAMTAPDVASAAWSAYSNGDTICVPAIEDTQIFDDLAIAERALLVGGNRAHLAHRYTEGGR